MFHYIYKVISSSGKYYIGRHSTDNMNDGYIGSGKWVRSIKDKSFLKKEIIEYFSDVHSLKRAEAKLLQEHIGKPNCMNYNNNSEGFAFGALNPNFGAERSEEWRHLMREKNLGANNPRFGKKHTDEHKFLLSVMNTGSNNAFFGKMHEIETKKIMSERAKNRERVICEYCNISCQPNMYSRWHGDKCKHRLKNYV